MNSLLFQSNGLVSVEVLMAKGVPRWVTCCPCRCFDDSDDSLMDISLIGSQKGSFLMTSRVSCTFDCQLDEKRDVKGRCNASRV